MSFRICSAALGICSSALATSHTDTGNSPAAAARAHLAVEQAAAIAQLPTVLITAPAPARLRRTAEADAGLLHGQPLAHVVAAHTQMGSVRLDEALVAEGLATPGAAGAPDLSPVVQMRGFVTGTDPANGLGVGRLYLGPHPDVSRRFVRDWATVESVSVLQGPQATLTGVGTPAGVVQYNPKTAGLTPHLRLHTGHDSTGAWRVALDWQTPVLPSLAPSEPALPSGGAAGKPALMLPKLAASTGLSTRVVAASQRDGLSADGMPTDRDTLYWTSRWRGTDQHWDVTLEHQHNQQPFGFGTVFVGGKFRFDQSYVDRSRSRASRTTERAALLHQRLLGNGISLQAWWQHARVRRDETLLGFFTILNPTTLSGYWRELDEQYSQRNMGLGLGGQHRAWGLQHDWQLQWQRNQQDMRMEGPQNIAGFKIDIEQPDFDAVDLSKLTLRPRWWLDQIHDQTLALRDRVVWSDAWQLHVGTAMTHMAVDSANNSLATAPTTLKEVTRGHWRSHSATLLHTRDQHQQWLTTGTGHEPTRGTQRDGSHLPPVTSTQWEAGWRINPTPNEAHVNPAVAAGAASNLPAQWQVSAWRIDQDHIAGTDPLDKNHLIPIGHVRSQGVGLRTSHRFGGLLWQGSVYKQSVRTLVPASASVGPYLAGTPSQWASLKLQWPRLALQPWLQVQAVGAKPGDSKHSFAAPGYGLLSMGLSHRINARWHMQAQLNNAMDKRYIASLTGADNAYQGLRRRAHIELRGQW